MWDAWLSVSALLTGIGSAKIRCTHWALHWPLGLATKNSPKCFEPTLVRAAVCYGQLKQLAILLRRALFQIQLPVVTPP